MDPNNKVLQEEFGRWRTRIDHDYHFNLLRVERQLSMLKLRGSSSNAWGAQPLAHIQDMGPPPRRAVVLRLLQHGAIPPAHPPLPSLVSVVRWILTAVRSSAWVGNVHTSDYSVLGVELWRSNTFPHTYSLVNVSLNAFHPSRDPSTGWRCHSAGFIAGRQY